jgi:DNA-binding transcriptional MerR regulator
VGGEARGREGSGPRAADRLTVRGYGEQSAETDANEGLDSRRAEEFSITDVMALLPIGQFARLSGLSIGALRHYDGAGLLRPAHTDPETGYRRYRRDQLERAHRIRRLRDLDIGLEELRAVLDAKVGDEAALLVEHRGRLEARSWQLQRRMHWLRQIIEGKEPLVTADARESQPGAMDRDAQRRLAGRLFNEVWTLLEHVDRTPDDDDRMVHAAHASRYHWGDAGDARNAAIGEWQCSRVYAALGRAEPALHHARRELELAERHRLGAFILATAYEALARASAVAGDTDALGRYRDQAREAAARIEDAEEREVVETDIASLPPVTKTRRGRR